MDKAKIELEIRLAAIEFLIQRIYSSLTSEYSDELFELMLQNYGATFDQTTLPSLGPVMSDHVTAEVRDRVLELLIGVKALRK